MATEIPILHCSHAPAGQIVALGGAAVILINGRSALDRDPLPGVCPWNASVVPACATCPRRTDGE
jgi:hypothetical protein